MSGIDWEAELNKIDHATKPMMEGPHTFRIVEAKPTRAQSGNEMIKLTCKAEGGPDDSKVGYVNIVFPFDNPRAMKMTLRRLRALGVSDEILRREKPSLDQIAAKLIGRSAEGNVSHRIWNDDVVDDIDFISAGGGGVPTIPTATTPGVPGVPSIPAVTEMNPAATTPAATPTAEAQPPTPQIPPDGGRDEEAF